MAFTFQGRNYITALVAVNVVVVDVFVVELYDDPEHDMQSDLSSVGAKPAAQGWQEKSATISYWFEVTWRDVGTFM